jgi:ABC-type Fe3+ transport system permease subunit
MSSPIWPARPRQAATSPRSTAGSPAVLLAWAALASAVLAFCVLQFSPTGLDPVKDAVSEWGLGPYAWGFRWFTISLAVAGAALAIPVGTSHHG